MNINKTNIGTTLIIFSAITIVVLLFNQGPIAQDLAYHNFSDSQAILSLPNAINVISNLPFLLVGLAGLYQLAQANSLQTVHSNQQAYKALFIGCVLIALGSAYYHINPNNQTLVWDRLAITIAFMALFSIVISEFVSENLGRLLLFPLIVLGLASVGYWRVTELNGMGDLRYYAVVQLFPIVTIPIILLYFPAKFSGRSAYWLLLVMYLLAKLFEVFDQQTHQLLTVISGHSIKHLLAATGLYILLRSFANREKI